VKGADAMKAELATGGPIACGIHVNGPFEAYDGGIFDQYVLLPMANHEISVVGYGSEDGVEYWIGRNSWGTYWGEEGFFRIRMHKHNLGIENDCLAAYPSHTPEYS
jgi:cathepsin X